MENNTPKENENNDKITNPSTFDEALPQIQKLIASRRHKWMLKGIPWLDYDDVSQILLIHLFNKFHLYDRTRPLAQWINSIITSQLINLTRNIFYKSARPCVRCPLADGENLCSFTKSGYQSEECPVYKKWLHKKKSSADINLPVSFSNHTNEVLEIPNQDDFDYEKGEQIIHQEMKKLLKEHEYRLYNLLYIEKLTEKEAAIRLGFRSNEASRNPGYGRIQQIKKIIMQKVEIIRQNTDLF